MAEKARRDPTLRKIDPGRSPRWKTALTLLVLAVAVLAVYFPIRTSPDDNTLMGLDYLNLHRFRIQFAQEALFGPHPHLPGWYPRELLGTPFWSNIQNFPFLPTRLVLLAFDPLHAYAIGIILAAELAALFAFLFARSLKLGLIGAAAAAWTFACSGYFASRVMSGQLPLLEAYPAVPMLLWLVHRCLNAPVGHRRTKALRILGAATGIVCLAGHPQIPAYSICAAAAYAIWMNTRRPGATATGTLRILFAMGLGAGMAAFVLWPMALLVARSSRFLPNGPVLDDVVFPYHRLLAAVFPWRDGWPRDVLRPPSPRELFGDRIIFWETVCYLGILPLVAVAAWLAESLWRRRLPSRRWAFLALLAIISLLLAFPPVHSAFAHLPGTVMRSPARLLYLTLFAIALTFGAAVDRALNLVRGRVWVATAVTLLLCVQAVDLGRHDRCFIRTVEVQPFGPQDLRLEQEVGDGRAAINHQLLIGINREVDDAGFYDSIALAKPYVAMTEISNLSLADHILTFDGDDLTPRALRVCGVRVFLGSSDQLTRHHSQSSNHQLLDLRFLKGSANRVDFFPLSQTITADLLTIHRDLRDQNYDLIHRLLIPAGSARPASRTPRLTSLASLHYSRNSEDKMTISAMVPQSGYLRIDEAWDRGWHATVDGKPVTLIAGDDVFLTLPLSPGYHKVILKFSTPGVIVGWSISIACFGMLMWITRSRRRLAAK